MHWLTKIWASAEPSVWVSVYAALLATILGVLRAVELFLDRRPKIIALVALTSLPDIGNTITLVNKSKTPANIYYYELVWVTPGYLQRYIPVLRRVGSTESPLTHEHADITIGAHSRYDLSFDDDYHFEWGVHLKNDIYLKIWIAGRRSPVWFLAAGAGGRR
jgi:hypothetical protein